MCNLKNAFFSERHNESELQMFLYKNSDKNTILRKAFKHFIVSIYSNKIVNIELAVQNFSKNLAIFFPTASDIFSTEKIIMII